MSVNKLLYNACYVNLLDKFANRAVMGKRDRDMLACDRLIDCLKVSVRQHVSDVVGVETDEVDRIIEVYQ